MWRILSLGHQRIGLSVYPLVLILAATGLLLSHSDSLGLSDKRVRFAPVLGWYGMAPAGEISSFPAGEHWATNIANHLLIDGNDFVHATSPCIGAVDLGSVLVLATRDALFLVEPSAQPELIDRLDGGALPGAVKRVGRNSGGRLVLDTDHGFFAADAQLLRFAKIEAPDVTWSQIAPAPERIREAALRAYRGDGLPLSRVLLDLHSGRIFGRFGPWLMDAAAVMLLFLSFSGVLQRYRTPRLRNG